MTAPTSPTLLTDPCSARQSTCMLASASVPAGFPSPAEDHLDRPLDLNEHLVQHPEATFYVRVSGDSMRDAGILDGDILVVDKSLSASHGQVVVAVLDGSFTVKTLHTRPVPALVPANPDWPVLYPTEEQALQVWGVVVGVVRRLCR